MNEGAYKNCQQLGKLLDSLPNLQLYQSADGDGLIQIVDGKVRRIATATDLGTLLMDHVKVAVIKNGKYHGERVTRRRSPTCYMRGCFCVTFAASRTW